MRVAILSCAVLLVACSKSEQKPDTQAAAPAAATAAPQGAPSITAAQLAGSWSGSTMPMTKDSVLTTAGFNITSTNEGWTLVLPNGTHPMRVIAIGGDSVVYEAGPFPSAVRKGKQVQLVQGVLHLKDNKLTGLTHATYVGGDTVTYRMEVTKKGS